MKKKGIVFAAVLAVALLIPIAAFAYETDAAGNTFSNDGNVTTGQFGSDFYWAGQSLVFSNATVKGDLIAAGYSIETTSATVGGNIRSAGNTLTVNSTAVAGNITIAGNSVQVGEGTTANGVYAAGSDVSFYGTTNQLDVSAKKLVLDGVVNGDANLDAQEVEFGPNAKVTGELKIQTKSMIDVPTSVAETYDITTSDSAGSIMDTGFTLGAGAIGFFSIMAILSLAIGTIVFALIIAWLMRKEVESAVTTFRERPGMTFLGGFLAMILLPVLAIALLLVVVTAPVSVVLFLLIIIIAIIAAPFSAAVFGRIFFKKMNRYVATLLCALIFSLLLAIPYVGAIFGIAYSMFTLGYFVHAVRMRIKSNKDPQPPVQGFQNQNNQFNYGSDDPYGGQQ